MSSPIDLLAEQAGALAELIRGMVSAGADSTLDELLSGAKDSTVLDLAARLGQIAKLTDAAAVRVAGEVAKRSDRALAEPLAKRLGEKSATHVLAHTADVSPTRAADWCRVGEQLHARTALTGEPLPSLRPVVADAVDRGLIGLDATRVILDALRAVDPFLSLDDLHSLETSLVDQAQLLGLLDLTKLCRSLPDILNPDGIEPREEQMRELRSMTVSTKRNGMIRAVIESDPESWGFIGTALDARVAPRRPVAFVDADELDNPDQAAADTRTLAQRRHDALVSMARDSLSSDTGDMSGTPVTMLVTVSHETLVSGIGSATIFGIDEPISATTARRLACDANIIPVVLGGDSQPLDLGTGRRLFTLAQRQAMAIRDGGCVWPGCDEPPSRCQAAHITPWHEGGPTDLTNGALLCPFHHRRFDLDGWTLEVHGPERYLIPPIWVDAARTPRRIITPRLAA
ncbi:DUF222 domain-containing protein [Amnibacterium flavum]|nr:HNH endonuclease signature motif containing protein [Amnibacterium flavum]